MRGRGRIKLHFGANAAEGGCVCSLSPLASPYLPVAPVLLSGWEAGDVRGGGSILGFAQPALEGSEGVGGLELQSTRPPVQAGQTSEWSPLP